MELTLPRSRDLLYGWASRHVSPQHRSDKFNDILTVAKSKCEEYAERRLFDRDGVNGAKFSLANNFKGWSEKPEQPSEKSEKELPQLYNALMEADENDVH